MTALSDLSQPELASLYQQLVDYCKFLTSQWQQAEAKLQGLPSRPFFGAGSYESIPCPSKSHTPAEVNTAVGDLIRSVPGSSVYQRQLFDSVYYVPTERDWNEIIAPCRWTNQIPYVPEIWDCEDYAYLAMALVNLFHGVNSIGMVDDESAGHEYNVVVLDDGTGKLIAKLWEPQTNQFVEPGSGLHIFKKGSYEL